MTLSDYLITVFLTTFSQLLFFLGPLLLIAFLMNTVAGWTEILSYKVLGRKLYLVLFGWLGTTFHELGHLFFAVIFMHRINEVKFFSLDSSEKTLGYVNHSYNPNNIYQQLGNFFIGIGPLIFCSIMLFIFTYLILEINVFGEGIVNISFESFSSIDSIINMGSGVLNSSIELFNQLIKSDIALWRLLLFIYFVYSIGSSIKLSLSDIRGAFSGLLFFTSILIFFNLSTLWMSSFFDNIMFFLSSYFSAVYFLMILSLTINLLFLSFFGIINQFFMK